MKRHCTQEDWDAVGISEYMARDGRTPCGRHYDDRNHSTLCPHNYIPGHSTIIRSGQPDLKHVLGHDVTEEEYIELLDAAHTTGHMTPEEAAAFLEGAVWARKVSNAH